MRGKMAKLNPRKLEKLIDFRKSREYVVVAQKIITDKFNHIKREMIQEFNNHPITREIEAGPRASNISGTLQGQGNLFSFIGFDSGDKPTAAIRTMLEMKTFINSIVVQKNGSINNVVAYPSPIDIFAITPLPWAEGRSWAEGIEKGLSGLGFYLKVQSDKSRSGEAVQTEEKIRSAKFSNTQYITSIIRNFEKKILILNKTRML